MFYRHERETCPNEVRYIFCKLFSYRLGPHNCIVLPSAVKNSWKKHRTVLPQDETIIFKK